MICLATARCDSPGIARGDSPVANYFSVRKSRSHRSLCNPNTNYVSFVLFSSILGDVPNVTPDGQFRSSTFSLLVATCGSRVTYNVLPWVCVVLYWRTRGDSIHDVCDGHMLCTLQMNTGLQYVSLFSNFDILFIMLTRARLETTLHPCFTSCVGFTCSPLPLL